MEKQNVSYSPSTGGFYLESIHGDAVPDDAVAITPELHTALIEGQSEGKIITPPDAEHGLPYLADPPPPTDAELTAQRIAAIDTRLAEIDTASVRPLRAIVDGSATEADAERLAAVESEAAALRAERASLTG